MGEALGELADGTPYFAPVGEVVTDGDLVTCHLCGRLLRSVAAHLRSHRWTKAQYCAAFGIERGQALEGPATRKLRATAFTQRLLFEPAVRAGSAAGRARARSGALSKDAAAAARGRPLPEQRRRKAAGALAAVPRDAIARGTRARAASVLDEVAGTASRRAGYACVGDMVRDRTAAGLSLAAISREAGLHKDWLSRHLAALDPHAAAVAADAAARVRTAGAEAAWQPVLEEAGFADVASYLREAHLVRHRTVNAIAAEAGVSHHAVAAALRRHGIAAQPHAASRHAAAQRETAVAAALGYRDVAGYVRARRDAGWTWAAMAAESGQPATWLRRAGR